MCYTPWSVEKVNLIWKFYILHDLAFKIQKRMKIRDARRSGLLYCSYEVLIFLKIWWEVCCVQKERILGKLND